MFRRVRDVDLPVREAQNMTSRHPYKVALVSYLGSRGRGECERVRGNSRSSRGR